MKVSLYSVVRTLLVLSLGVASLLTLSALTGILYAPEWASPWAWALLIPVALLPLQPVLTGRNRLAVPGEMFKRHVTIRTLLAWLPGALLYLSLGLMVLALARPQIVERKVVRTGEGLDILLAIDTSCSMEATDLSTSSPGRFPVGGCKRRGLCLCRRATQ